MILVKTSDNGIFDLNTGTLYSKDSNNVAVQDWVIVYFKGQLAMTVKGKYAEALWEYLNSHLKVSPDELPPLYPTEA